MALKLELLYKTDELKTLTVSTVWQDIHMGFERLYFETMNQERGKGSTVKIEDLKTWRVTSAPHRPVLPL